MGRSDYVPANAAQFKFFMENIIKYVAPKITEQPQDWPVPIGGANTRRIIRAIP